MTAMPWDKIKLSEKTLELNFASQLNHHCGGKLLWFGLTQMQEAEAGFDIATRIGKALFIVQMKASATLLKSKARQFKVPHEQLKRLRKLKVAGQLLPPDSVFYAFPVLGTTKELANHTDVLGNTWLCDVANLKAVTAPTTKAGSPRKDDCHYVNVTPGEAPLSPSSTGEAVFHSEPVTVAARSGDAFASDLVESQFSRGLLTVMNDNNFRDFWKLCELFKRKAFGVVLVN